MAPFFLILTLLIIVIARSRIKMTIMIKTKAREKIENDSRLTWRMGLLAWRNAWQSSRSHVSSKF